MIDHAIAYNKAGWVIIPMIPATKRAYVKWKRIAEPDRDQITRWWTRWPDASIGVLCGPSNLIVVDVDELSGLEFIPDLPLTATVTTGRGHHHIYRDRSQGELRNTNGRVPVRGVWVETPGIDLRASGGLFVAPPSIHKTGATYTWDNPSTQIAPAPGWLRPVIPKPIRVEYVDPDADCSNQIEAIIDVVVGAANGQRNSCLNWAACKLGELVTTGHITRQTAYNKLLVAADRVGLGENESEATARSGLDYGMSA